MGAAVTVESIAVVAFFGATAQQDAIPTQRLARTHGAGRLPLSVKGAATWVSLAGWRTAVKGQRIAVITAFTRLQLAVAGDGMGAGGGGA
jgi:hypothetical protein